jgi:hypothetical protein
MNLSQGTPVAQSSKPMGDAPAISRWQAAGFTPTPQPAQMPINIPPRFAKTGFAEFQNGNGYPTDTNQAGQAGPDSARGALPASYRGQGFDNSPPQNAWEDNSYPWPDNAGSAQGRPSGQPNGLNYPAGAWDRPERLPQPMPSGPVPNPANPNVRNSPTAAGQYLLLAPNETAAERAVYLARVLEATQAEAATLRERVRVLEAQQQQLEKARAEGSQLADQAANEMARARTQMESLHGEVVALRERLRRLDRQDLDTLREVVDALERVLQDDIAKKH